jgi:hypothetical protein
MAGDYPLNIGQRYINEDSFSLATYSTFVRPVTSSCTIVSENEYRSPYSNPTRPERPSNSICNKVGHMMNMRMTMRIRMKTRTRMRMRIRMRMRMRMRG